MISVVVEDEVGEKKTAIISTHGVEVEFISDQQYK